MATDQDTAEVPADVVDVARLILHGSVSSYDETTTERRQMAREAAQRVIAFFADRSRRSPAAQPEGWRPIGTCPKDGTRILCICMKAKKGSEEHVGLVAVDYWHTRDKHTYEGFGKFNDRFWPATHWMPLPAPPTPPDQKEHP